MPHKGPATFIVLLKQAIVNINRPQADIIIATIPRRIRIRSFLAHLLSRIVFRLIRPIRCKEQPSACPIGIRPEIRTARQLRPCHGHAKKIHQNRQQNTQDSTEKRAQTYSFNRMTHHRSLIIKTPPHTKDIYYECNHQPPQPPAKSSAARQSRNHSSPHAHGGRKSLPPPSTDID